MTIDDVVHLARQRAQDERNLAIQMEADGFPLAAMPHDVAGAALESFARSIVILDGCSDDLWYSD